MPLLGLGRLVRVMGDHESPRSGEVERKMRPLRVRPTARRWVPPAERMEGWMAAMDLPSLMWSVRDQLRPRSGERSKWTRQPSFSVLEGQRREPSGRAKGLFLTGPVMLSGRRVGVDHVRPWSEEEVRMPHHESGLGPHL